MRRESEEFRRRFMSRVKERLSDTVCARQVYLDYMDFVGETSDGLPEDDADEFINQGGA